ncbi:MAG TPA: hypothetical protein DEQ14_00345 [Treponema sp.]|nr:hypothetical protein [Treponema sp.]
MNVSLALAVASVIICLLFFLYFRWYIGRKISARELLADYRTEALKLIAEIDAATDRDALLVEERIRTLKSILEDADKRIAVYLRDMERGRQGQSLYTSLGRAARTEGEISPPTAPARRLADAISSVSAADSTEPVSNGGAERGKSGKTLAETSSAQTSASGAKPELRTQIAELAAKGNSPQKIASKLNISQSEVDLALNLLQR